MTGLSRDLIDSLFLPDLPTPAELEKSYPPRGLAAGAEVTRFAPSPTGWLHIGGIFTASVNRDIAHQEPRGVYLLRIEDTDQSRFEKGALTQFEVGFNYFGIRADEAGLAYPGMPAYEADEVTLETHEAVLGGQGKYGPYRQSAREAIYHSYVRELARQGKAYPCFETPEQAEARTARQKAVGALPGYYGEWATWRDAPKEQVRQRLAADDPFVVRFRSPGLSGHRVSFTDVIRGEITADDNRNDIVILKRKDNSERRLPTYHLAHVVDDHLMRVTLVIRGEEWLSSVPLHHQLFDALGFDRIRYAHIAPLMKQDGGSRRKLSKRKDPEASVDFYVGKGYPPDAVKYYLRGLANARLAEMPLGVALAEPLRLKEFGVAGPLLDMAKLDDICADFVASLSAAEILDLVKDWARKYQYDLYCVLRDEGQLALDALSIERGPEVPNPRKDLRKWADFRPVYGYFFAKIFERVTDPADPRFGGVSPDLVRALATGFADGYMPPSRESEVPWFDQIRALSVSLGFAPNQKAYKRDPSAYPGSIADASAVIRVLITGTRQSPDLAAICEVLGTEQVLRRARSLTG